MKKQILLTIAITISLAISTFAQVTVQKQPGQPPVNVKVVQGKTQEIQVPAKVNQLYVQLQHLEGNDQGKDSYTSYSDEIWRNVAKFIEANSHYVTKQRSEFGGLKTCLEYGEDMQVGRVQCVPNQSIFYVDMRSRVKVNVKFDEAAAKRNQKLSIWQTVAQIGSIFISDQLYRRGKWTAGELTRYGGFQAAMTLEAQKSPTHYIVLTYQVDIDNFGFVDTTHKPTERIDRRFANFKLHQKFFEYTVRVYDNGRGEIVEFIFNGEKTQTADGGLGWKFDDITLPFKGTDLGNDWAEKLEAITAMRIAYYLIGTNNQN